MDIVIRIPNSNIPKHHGIVDISLSFMDGKVTDAHGYGFCQLEPHGRLIDGDYLYKRLRANKCPDELVYKFVREEPTILEATEDE